MSSLTANKVGALFVFFGTSFTGVFLPYFIPVRPLFLKMGLLFASGLFLALAFLHLAVDCVENFGEIYTGEYPLAYLLIPLGFYMTWFADLLAHAIWQKRARGHKTGHTADLECAKVEKSSSAPRLSCCRSSSQLLDTQQRCQISACSCTSEEACQCAQLMYPEAEPNGAEGPSVTGALTSLGTDGEGGGGVQGLPLLDVFLLLIALVFHAFFEGLAVGLAESVHDVWQMTASICLNEVFEGMALGSTLRAQDAKRHWFNFMLYAIGASIVAPLGLAVGIVLETTTTPEAATWASGIGLGLAAGVFVCIATRHLIAKAMVPEGPKEAMWMPFLKFFVSGLGLAVNACLTMMPEE